MSESADALVPWDPPASDSSSGCPHEGDIVAYVHGELTEASRAAFADHLESCWTCREGVCESREVTSLLFDTNTREDIGDFVASTVARLELELPRTRRRDTATRRLVAGALAAAACLGIAFVLFVMYRDEPSAAPSLESATRDDVRTGETSLEVLVSERRALRWLADHQTERGSWSAGALGSDFEVGVTALVSLAFLGGASDGIQERDRVIRQALDYLAATQGESGRFGPAGMAVEHNHAVALVALLEAYRQSVETNQPAPLERTVIERGLDYLVAHLASRRSSEPGRMQTVPADVWTLQALLLARVLELGEFDVAIAQTARRLESCCAESPADAPLLTVPGDPRVAMARFGLRLLYRAGYDVDVACAESPIDLRGGTWRRNIYYDIFAVAACDGVAAVTEHTGARAVRDAIRARQSLDGANRGSWSSIDESWSKVSGRVFSTATATLILQSQRQSQVIDSWLARL